MPQAAVWVIDHLIRRRVRVGGLLVQRLEFNILAPA